MLQEIRIKNFVIIDDLSVSFREGLNILTGETGAGKSILIDAISGVLGEKMTTDMIRSGFEKSTLEAVFDISDVPRVLSILEESGIDCDDTLIIRRELFATGKGRCFANAVQIPLAKLREISEYLLDIHGQNEHQNIVKIAKHRELLDSFAGHGGLVEKMRSIHASLSDLREKLTSHEIDEKEKARRIEYNNYAVREIESAKLKPGEDDELKNESTILANAEKLFNEISASVKLLHDDGGIIPKLSSMEQSLSRISRYDTDVSNILESAKEALFTLEDVSHFLKNYEKNINFSPERINQIEERLALISGMKKKYGNSIEEIIGFAERARKELDAISFSEEELEKLNARHREIIREAKETALDLSEKRKTAAKRLEELVMKELAALGMANTVFRISIQREQNPEGEIESENRKYLLYPHGIDRTEFLLSANEGEDLRQLSKIASGGEMSRIMLAIKNVLLSSDIVESLIFDEIDAGVSGKIADMVGKKMKSLAKNRQVLAITHLPQIAAMSDSHYSVQKTRSGERITTTVKLLSRKEKIFEIAKLLAGEKITDLTIKHAEEMVEIAEKM